MRWCGRTHPRLNGKFQASCCDIVAGSQFAFTTNGQQIVLLTLNSSERGIWEGVPPGATGEKEGSDRVERSLNLGLGLPAVSVESVVVSSQSWTRLLPLFCHEGNWYLQGISDRHTR